MIFRVATALFIAPQNSGSFFQRVRVESSIQGVIRFFA
jgi:hypothetical protein